MRKLLSAVLLSIAVCMTISAAPASAQACDGNTCAAFVEAQREKTCGQDPVFACKLGFDDAAARARNIDYRVNALATAKDRHKSPRFIEEYEALLADDVAKLKEEVDRLSRKFERGQKSI